MKTDYSEFIARHHKIPGATHTLRDKRRYISLLTSVLIMCLYLVVMAFVVVMARIDSATIMVSVAVFIAAATVAFAAKRAQYLQAEQEKELVLLKEVLEGSRGGRLITDKADKTLYYNQKFLESCPTEGLPTYEGLIGMFSDNEQVESLIAALSDKAHRGLVDSIELYCSKTDYEGWYQVSVYPVAGHPGYIHWRLDNVTDRHTAAQAKQQERESLIDFIDNAPVGFFSLNEEGRFIFANATLSRWLGEDLATILAHGKLHTYLEQPPKKAAPYDLLEKGGARQTSEIRMKGAGGKTFLASISQEVEKEDDGSVRTRAVVHDLTTEREMKSALKASEDRFQRFFEEAPLGIILVNKNGLIEDCNNAFAQMMGMDIAALESKHFKLLIADDDRDVVLSAMKETQKGQSMSAAMEVRLKAGERDVATQLHARRFRESNSIVLHFIDITDKKSLEEQFVQSQKMQAVGQLAGGVAHDFNNLLTAIIGFCDLLMLRHKPGDPSFGDIMQIKQNSNRAANLVRQLLAFSRQQTLRQRVHDVTDILTELSHLLRRLIGANIELQIVHGDDLGLVKVDEGQMEQVLINLAVNARDAMDAGGTLTIATENFTNDKLREINTEEMPPGDWTLIKVSDTGCGISKANMSRIFEPFFTTKEVGQGTGLGLATVYGIVRQSGGYLEVESKVGKGTTFLIYLPWVSEAEEDEDIPKVEESTEKPQDLTGTECVLLVEDEDAVRTFSQRALVNKGYEVLTAASGESALTVFEETQGKQPVDLLITDVVMPGMDGPTLAGKIRKVCPDLKIIFISGYSEEKLKDYRGENIFFLPKPFTLKQLAAKVKDVLGG